MISSLREPMTIAELKRHMDRRFDRLERTKADKHDLRRFAIKKHLQRFATKKDLQRFATKKDLRRFATKKDLRRFATKKDLRRFATKKDLRRFATKKDLRRFATKKDLRRFSTKTEMRLWSVDIKRYFDVVAEGLEEKLQKVADGVADIAAMQLHIAHHDKVLDEHETRITALERNP
jgi:hypothetical protein